MLSDMTVLHTVARVVREERGELTPDIVASLDAARIALEARAVPDPRRY